MENKKPQLNDQLSFLVACCQIDPSETDIKHIHTTLHTEQPDTQTLLDLATQHGILPLVYKTIKHLSQSDDTLGTTHSPLSILINELKTHYMRISQRNMLMSAELIRIMKCLEDHNVETLAFKGPVLSQMAYGDITQRQYSDLDILVDEKEITKAGLILEKNGYTPAFPIKVLENKTCLQVTNDLGFHNQKNGTWIELHWKLFREKIGKHLHFEQISENKQNIHINGQPIQTLSTEMLLVYLCLHGSKHAWERIEWICDIDRLIHSSKNINWDTVVNIANDMDTQTSLFLGLKLSHMLFDTTLPKNIIPMTETKRIEDLITKTFTLLESDILKTENYSRYRAIHHYQMDLLDTKFKKIQHFFSTYFSISRNDCQSFPLPTPLKFLYLVIKPFRVLSKYIQYGK